MNQHKPHATLNDDDLKKWIYSIFFSTKERYHRIQIVDELYTDSKKNSNIAKNLKMSYHHVRYHIDSLEQNKFLIKNNKTYSLSSEFKKKYYVLNNIIEQRTLV